MGLITGDSSVGRAVDCSWKSKSSRYQLVEGSIPSHRIQCAFGVMVTCKVSILALGVRFPEGALNN